jgi:hypothetical protein
MPTTVCLVDAAAVQLAAFVDCTRVSGSVKVSADYYDPYDPSLLGLKVMKVGSTTGLTVGEVYETAASYEATGMRGNIRYPFGYKVMSVSDQGPFTLPGDSGSLVTDLQGRPAGMVVAMDKSLDASALTFCIPIAFVIEALDIRLIGDCPWDVWPVPASPL